MRETVGDFLAGLRPPTREIALGLREIVRGLMPGAHEFIYHHALTYGTTESSMDRFCYIAPFTSHVNLGFMFGAGLEDPRGLLEGEGKRLRHVKVRSRDEARSPELPRLLQQAWEKAPRALEEMKAGRRKR